MNVKAYDCGIHGGQWESDVVPRCPVCSAPPPEDELVGRIVRFLVDAGCEPAAAMVEIEFGRPPSE